MRIICTNQLELNVKQVGGSAQKMVKEQRFERVVEWKVKPKWSSIIWGVIIITFNFIFAIRLSPHLANISSSLFGVDYFLAVFVGSCSIWLGVEFITFNAGEGRKVYWRKIK